MLLRSGFGLFFHYFVPSYFFLVSASYDRYDSLGLLLHRTPFLFCINTPPRKRPDTHDCHTVVLSSRHTHLQGGIALFAIYASLFSIHLNCWRKQNKKTAEDCNRAWEYNRTFSCIEILNSAAEFLHRLFSFLFFSELILVFADIWLHVLLRSRRWALVYFHILILHVNVICLLYLKFEWDITSMCTRNATLLPKPCSSV